MATKTGYENARAAITGGRAKAHALWVLLANESDRDGYALKPSPWEGSGEYQHVTYGAEDLGVFVRIPDGGPSLKAP